MEDEKLVPSILGHGRNMWLLETTKVNVNRCLSLAYQDSNRWIQLRAFLKGTGLIHAACLTS